MNDAMVSAAARVPGGAVEQQLENESVARDAHGRTGGRPGARAPL